MRAALEEDGLERARPPDRLRVRAQGAQALGRDQVLHVSDLHARSFTRSRIQARSLGRSVRGFFLDFVSRA